MQERLLCIDKILSACTWLVCGEKPHTTVTVQVWTLSQPTPAFTLDGHDKGVNSVDYFSGGMLSPFLANFWLNAACDAPPPPPSLFPPTRCRNITSQPKHFYLCTSCEMEGIATPATYLQGL